MRAHASHLLLHWLLGDNNVYHVLLYVCKVEWQYACQVAQLLHAWHSAMRCCFGCLDNGVFTASGTCIQYLGLHAAQSVGMIEPVAWSCAILAE